LVAVLGQALHPGVSPQQLLQRGQGTASVYRVCSTPLPPPLPL
jgi:hypothetical protein